MASQVLQEFRYRLNKAPIWWRILVYILIFLGVGIVSMVLISFLTHDFNFLLIAGGVLGGSAVILILVG